MMSILHIAGYRFIPLSNLSELQVKFRQFCTEKALKGSIMLSLEGINFMLAGEPSAVACFKTFLEEVPSFSNMSYRESTTSTIPFKRLFVKIKKQLTPFKEKVNIMLSAANYLAPRQLKEWLDEGKPFVLLDARNDYEITQGAFKEAQHLNLKHFCDFEEAALALPQEMKSQPIVTYCTGGIRCEKIVPFLRQNGFKEIYQLHGGILQYFHDCGDVHFDGACYVFDERVVIKKGDVL